MSSSIGSAPCRTRSRLAKPGKKATASPRPSRCTPACEFGYQSLRSCPEGRCPAVRQAQVRLGGGPAPDRPSSVLVLHLVLTHQLLLDRRRHRFVVAQLER